MRAAENLRLSVRFLRMRFLESALAVAGTTLGVAIISSAVTLIQTYNAGVARELSSPIYRLIEATPQTSQRVTDTPIARVGPASGDTAQLSLSDIPALKAECPSVDWVFAASHELASVGDVRGGASFISSGTMAAPSFSAQVEKGGVEPPAGMVGTLSFSGEAPEGMSGGMVGIAIAGEGDMVQFGDMPIQIAPEETAGSTLTETLTPLVKEFDIVRITEDAFAAFDVKLARGSLFTAQDAETGSPVMVLGAELAKRMFGDQDPLGGRFKCNGTVYTVVGILAPAPYAGPEKNDVNRWAFVPFAQPVIRLKGGAVMSVMSWVRTMSLAVKDPAKLRTAVREAEAYFTRTAGENAMVLKANLVEAEQSRANHNRLFIVIGFLAGCALLISSITLLNLMTTRILRRARSIGIFRSFGARRADIFAIFLGESLLLTMLGGVVGFALAPFLYRLLLTQLIPASWGMDTTQGVNWLVMTISLVGAVALNVLFGVFPAAQAARTRVVDAIRAE